MNIGNLSDQETEPTSGSAIRIFIVGRGDHGCSFTVKGNSASIGRDYSNDVQLDEPSVSREHALISREGDRYFIEDLEAKNRTRINGRAISAKLKVPVKEGVPILIGSVLMSLGKRCPENIQLLQGSRRARDTEESLFDYRVIKYKQILKTQQDLCSSFLKTLDVEKICGEALHAIFSFLKIADGGCVLLADGEPHARLREMAAYSRQRTLCRGMKYSESLVEEVIRDRRAMIIPGTESEVRKGLTGNIQEVGIKSALCVPLISKSGMRGVIYIQSETPESRFSKEDLFFVNSFSAPLTLAIESGLLYEKHKEAETVLKRAQDDLETAVRERTAELEKTKEKGYTTQSPITKETQQKENEKSEN